MDADEEFAGALIRLSLAVQYVHQDISRIHDLTPQQAVLMFSLLDGPVGMAELSDRLHVEKSTLTDADRVLVSAKFKTFLSACGA